MCVYIYSIRKTALPHLCGKHTRTGDPNPTLRSAGRAGAIAGGSDTERWNSLGFLVSSPHCTTNILQQL